MQDKTAIENNENANTPSKAFREYIESLVEEIVLNNAVFNDHKKYLQRYSQEEGVDYDTLEKNLTGFFDTLEELKSHESKALERFAEMLGMNCYLEEGTVDELLAAVNKAREKEAERIAKEERERRAREEADRIAAEKKAEEERVAALKKAEKERIAREKLEREAAEDARQKAEEERKRKEQEDAKQKDKGVSDLLRQYIEVLVEEVVIDGKPFNDQKKRWLQRYSQEECVDCAMLENNLTEFFEILEELKSHESKVVEHFAKKLGKDCYLEESKVDELLAAVNEAREKEIERIAAEKKAEEERIAALKKAEEERIAREKAEREAVEEARRKAKEEAERKDREERERRIREDAERKAKEERERKEREEAERRAREERERKTSETRSLDVDKDGSIFCTDENIRGKLSIPSTLKGKTVCRIKDKAFEFCAFLTGIVIPDSVTEIGESAFSCCYGLISIVIPNSVMEIRECAFHGCRGLTSIVIPNSVIEIRELAFFSCTGLTNIVIPNSVMKIRDLAFSNCTGLTNIVIPNSVMEIGDLAFDGCTGLKSAKLPKRFKGQEIFPNHTKVEYY